MKNPFLFSEAAVGCCVVLCILISSCSRSIPEESLALYLNASDAYEKGSFSDAREEFAGLVEKHPSFHQAAFMEGKSAFMAGDIEEAAAVFNHLRKRIPEHFDAAFWYARCLAQIGRLEEAETEFASLLSYNSQDPRIMYQLALIKIEEKDIPEALAYLRKAGFFAEEFSRVFLHLGRLYYQFEMDEKAVSELVTAAALLPRGHPLLPGIQDLIEKIEEDTK